MMKIKPSVPPVVKVPFPSLRLAVDLRTSLHVYFVLYNYHLAFPESIVITPAYANDFNVHK